MKELTSEGAGREGRDKWGSKGKMDNEGHKNVFSKSNDFGTRYRVPTKAFFPLKIHIKLQQLL